MPLKFLIKAFCCSFHKRDNANTPGLEGWGKDKETSTCWFECCLCLGDKLYIIARCPKSQVKLRMEVSVCASSIPRLRGLLDIPVS